MATRKVFIGKRFGAALALVMGLCGLRHLPFSM